MPTAYYDLESGANVMVLVVISCKGDAMSFHIFSKKLKNITKDKILSFLTITCILYTALVGGHCCITCD
jgi:hypothetical protein